MLLRETRGRRGRLHWTSGMLTFYKFVNDGIHKLPAIIRLENARRAKVGKNFGRETEGNFFGTLVHEWEQNMDL